MSIFISVSVSISISISVSISLVGTAKAQSTMHVRCWYQCLSIACSGGRIWCLSYASFLVYGKPVRQCMVSTLGNIDKSRQTFALASLEAVLAGSLRHSHNPTSAVVLQTPQHALAEPPSLLIRRSCTGSVEHSANSKVTKSGREYHSATA